MTANYLKLPFRPEKWGYGILQSKSGGTGTSRTPVNYAYWYYTPSFCPKGSEISTKKPLTLFFKHSTLENREWKSPSSTTQNVWSALLNIVCRYILSVILLLSQSRRLPDVCAGYGEYVSFSYVDARIELNFMNIYDVWLTARTCCYSLFSRTGPTNLGGHILKSKKKFCFWTAVASPGVGHWDTCPSSTFCNIIDRPTPNLPHCNYVCMQNYAKYYAK